MSIITDGKVNRTVPMSPRKPMAAQLSIPLLTICAFPSGFITRIGIEFFFYNFSI